MRLVAIDDLNDPRVAPYRNLRDATLASMAAHGGGVFMAEGELVVRRLIESGRWGVASAVVRDARLERMRDALERLPEATEVYVVSQQVMDGVVGFHLHQGCLALGVRGPALRAEQVIDAPPRAGAGPTVVVMEELANHDNVGGVFRNAAALGAAGVLMTDQCADPLYRKAIRVSMGVPFARVPALPQGYAALRRSGCTVMALTPSPDAADLREFAEGRRERPRRAAIVVGAEGPGLSRAAIEGADVRVRIDMAPGMDSLNVATATGMALWALAEPID